MILGNEKPIRLLNRHGLLIISKLGASKYSGLYQQRIGGAGIAEVYPDQLPDFEGVPGVEEQTRLAEIHQL
jgi:hypothetical protein